MTDILRPTKCPLGEWIFDEDTPEDKRTIQPETGRCFFPAIALRHGLHEIVQTPNGFICPLVNSTGGDYIDCDLFSKWWWYQFGGKVKPKKGDY